MTRFTLYSNIKHVDCSPTESRHFARLVVVENETDAPHRHIYGLTRNGEMVFFYFVPRDVEITVEATPGDTLLRAGELSLVLMKEDFSRRTRRRGVDTLPSPRECDAEIERFAAITQDEIDRATQ